MRDRIAEILSGILSIKYDANIVIHFGEPMEDHYEYNAARTLEEKQVQDRQASVL